MLRFYQNPKYIGIFTRGLATIAVTNLQLLYNDFGFQKSTFLLYLGKLFNILSFSHVFA